MNDTNQLLFIDGAKEAVRAGNPELGVHRVKQLRCHSISKVVENTIGAIEASLEDDTVLGVEVERAISQLDHLREHYEGEA